MLQFYVPEVNSVEQVCMFIGILCLGWFNFLYVCGEYNNRALSCPHSLNMPQYLQANDAVHFTLRLKTKLMKSTRGNLKSLKENLKKHSIIENCFGKMLRYCLDGGFIVTVVFISTFIMKPRVHNYG